MAAQWQPAGVDGWLNLGAILSVRRHRGLGAVAASSVSADRRDVVRQRLSRPFLAGQGDQPGSHSRRSSSLRVRLLRFGVAGFQFVVAVVVAVTGDLQRRPSRRGTNDVSL
jgi:hypothetical protein